MNQELIREEIRRALLENWSSEVIAMIRDELANKTPFAKWWNGAPPAAKQKFLKSQFKLNTALSADVIRTFATTEDTVTEFGENLVGKYRGTRAAYTTTSSGRGGLPKGYVPKSAPSPDKNKIVRTAKRYARAKNLDTLAVQSRRDGNWRVYGRAAGNAFTTPKYF